MAEINEVVKNLSLLSEEDRRLLYEIFVKAASEDSNGGSKFIKFMDRPKHISNSPQETRAWIKLADYLADVVRKEGKFAVWNLYEEILSGEQSKELGQYFTPSHVADLALRGLRQNQNHILDPMAGHGVFLRECRKQYPAAKLVGVDIDSLPLSVMNLMADEKLDVINSDVFKWSTESVKYDPSLAFTAIVGNPAYINYQNLQNIGRLANYANNSQNTKGDYRTYLLDVLSTLAKLKGVSRKIEPLLANLSGLSDFATYTLILAWILLEENGQIAFVMSNHWMERDYGRTIRDFFASTGTIRGIVTHRQGLWFSKAEIPTSIFVFTKGAVSQRQKTIGVPYIEIESPKTENIVLHLHSLLERDFWDWVDSLDAPSQHGPLNISFRRWKSDMARDDNHNLVYHQHLRLPSNLEQTIYLSLDDIGWSVHQGLRTGCNELFYVKKKESDKYLTSLTKGNQRLETELTIPSNFLRPAIRKVLQRNPLFIGSTDTDSYLLNLSGKITQYDKESLAKYPRRWLNAWGISRMEIIPKQLADHLHDWSVVPYEGKGKVRRPIMELSAVRTNIFVPPLESPNKIPSRPRFWYQIQIQRRHYGEVFIPRVSSGPLRAFLVKDPGSVIIDANFLTFISGITSVSPRRLWIWLNSNVFRIICEQNGVVLGGGALKIEAELLSRVPIPGSIMKLGDSETEKIAHLLESSNITGDDLVGIGKIIDELLFDSSVAEENVERLKRLLSQRQK